MGSDLIAAAARGTEDGNWLRDLRSTLVPQHFHSSCQLPTYRLRDRRHGQFRVVVITHKSWPDGHLLWSMIFLNHPLRSHVRGALFWAKLPKFSAGIYAFMVGNGWNACHWGIFVHQSCTDFSIQNQLSCFNGALLYSMPSHCSLCSWTFVRYCR